LCRHSQIANSIISTLHALLGLTQIHAIVTLLYQGYPLFAASIMSHLIAWISYSLKAVRILLMRAYVMVIISPWPFSATGITGEEESLLVFETSAAIYT